MSTYFDLVVLCKNVRIYEIRYRKLDSISLITIALIIFLQLRKREAINNVRNFQDNKLHLKISKNIIANFSLTNECIITLAFRIYEYLRLNLFDYSKNICTDINERNSA